MSPQQESWRQESHCWDGNRRSVLHPHVSRPCARTSGAAPQAGSSLLGAVLALSLPLFLKPRPWPWCAVLTGTLGLPPSGFPCTDRAWHSVGPCPGPHGRGCLAQGSLNAPSDQAPDCHSWQLPFLAHVTEPLPSAGLCLCTVAKGGRHKEAQADVGWAPAGCLHHRQSF